MKNGLLFIILLFLSLVTRAQFVNFGQDRACLRWKQIKTEDFQIIYPDFFEDNAQKDSQPICPALPTCQHT